MSAEKLAELLHLGLKQLAGSNAGAPTESSLIHYVALLQRWNSAYNLTAAKTPAEMITRHVLDSLSVLPWIEPGSLLDAGTGAGLPGIPLAIVRRELQVTLLDSTGKKIRFLRNVRRELGLRNIFPVQERLESYKPPSPPAQVISRAFASLADFASGARHLASANEGSVRLLAMKGRYPESELTELPGWVVVESIEKPAVPGLQEERHLVIMTISP